MKLLITVINESQLHPALHLDGISGKPFTFLWDKTLDRYAYEPKNQDEINDIFGTQGVICPWHLSPVIVDGEMGKVSKAYIPPFIARRLYENHSEAELLALAADVGLEVKGTGQENILRQIDAYMLGRAWGAKHPVELPADTTAEFARLTDIADRCRLDASQTGDKLAAAREESKGLRADLATSEREVSRLTKALAKAEAKAAQTKTGRTAPAPKPTPETPVVETADV